MCTLSAIPLTRDQPAGMTAIRLVCNRDEARLRPAAVPPRVENFGARQAILPRDPQAGGTWIAVNDAGLALVLLNAYSEPDALPRPAKVTRGAIIPSLLDANTLDEAVARAGQIDAARFAPFRLVVLDRREIVELAIQDGSLTVRERADIVRPLMHTSSGLGDALVGEPRRRLFTEMFSGDDDWTATQDAFHRHRWPGREGISVAMNRDEACTVSQTIIEIDARHTHMTYLGAPPDRPVAPITISLPISVGV